MLYVDGAGVWTANLDQAQVFDSGLEAILYCLNHQMFNMQILGEFADQRLNFSVPVTDRRED